MNPTQDNQASDRFEFPAAPLPSHKVGAAIRAAIQGDARKSRRLGRGAHIWSAIDITGLLD